MKTVIDYLDDLKEKFGSDYRSAQLMEVDKTCVSNIRRRGLMSDETAMKVAKILGIDPSEVLIAAAMARSEGEVKTAWENLGKRAGIAASLILAVSIGTGIQESEAGISNKTLTSIIYIMRSQDDRNDLVNGNGFKVALTSFFHSCYGFGVGWERMHDD